MLRFVSNAKKGQCERRGELLPDEFRAAEEQTIKMAHLESFPDEIKALHSNKPIHKKTPLLPLILCWLQDYFASTRVYATQKPSGWEICNYTLNYTLNCLRERDFVIHGRSHVKRCIKECAERKRLFRGTLVYQPPRDGIIFENRNFLECPCTNGGQNRMAEVDDQWQLNKLRWSSAWDQGTSEGFGSQENNILEEHLKQWLKRLKER